MTKSSRLCSSRGSKYPRAPSRFRCSISRRVAAAAGARRGEAAAAAAWARLLLELGLGRLGACHGPARRPLPWPPAAANQPGFLAGWPGAAPAGGATRGTQETRSLQEASAVGTSFSPVVHRRMGSAVQSLAGGPGNGRTAPGPILGEGSERLRGTSVCLLVSFWLGSRLPPPPTPAELSRRRPRRFLRRSLRKASGRSTAALRPGVGP